MNRNPWCFAGICALLLGVAIVVVALVPSGGALFLTALLLIVCGIGCIRRR